MSYQIKVVTDVVTEPVTLDEAKAWCKIDLDYARPDAELDLMISTAREIIEENTNIGLAERTLELQWDGRAVEMPLSPTGVILSVTDPDGNVLTTDDYLLSAYEAKSIAIKSLHCGAGIEFFYGIDHTVSVWQATEAMFDGVYKCIYKTGFPNLTGPSRKKMREAILTQIDFMNKQQGRPDNSLVSEQALILCKGFSRNLIL